MLFTSANSMNNFLAPMVVPRLAHHPALPTASLIESLEAAVLFADISGFTPHICRQNESASLPDHWHPLAAVQQNGIGVTLYLDGHEVGHRANALPVIQNSNSLIIGREA